MIERDPFEGLDIDERMGLKWALKGRVQQYELDYLLKEMVVNLWVP